MRMKSPPPKSHCAICTGPHQLLKGGLVQVALECELAECFPGRLVRLHLDCAALHRVLMADGAACHQRRPSQSLEALRGKQTDNTRALELSQLLHHFGVQSPRFWRASWELNCLEEETHSTAHNESSFCSGDTPGPTNLLPGSLLGVKFQARETEIPSQVCETKQNKTNKNSDPARFPPLPSKKVQPRSPNHPTGSTLS